MYRINWIFLFAFCSVAVARTPPKIKIPGQGTIMGKEVSKNRVLRIVGYYGIPYASPPLQNLRFAPPVVDPLPSWDGVRNATEYAPACLQKEDYGSESLAFMKLLSNGNNFATDEDCLYLNVFVPYGEKPSFDGFATIIWLHPGNFTTGNPEMWNPHTLVYRYRIIVVTLSWRLNVMGFFTTGDSEAPGNYGLQDQQAAMAWVKKNIKLFGGNPDNICLMGYGTGANSIGLHMTSSTKLFDKAIVMSGNFLNPLTVKQPQEDRVFLDTLANEFGCIRYPTSLFLECLRNVDGRVLVQVTSDNDWKPSIDIGLTINETLPVVPELTRTLFENGNFTAVPLLTGYTNMESILSTTKNMDYDNLTIEESRIHFDQFLKDMITGDIPLENSDNNDYYYYYYNNNYNNRNNYTKTCIANHNLMLDSVKFFYEPSSEIQDAEAFGKAVAEITTDKNYGASTFLHASYASKEQPTFVYRFDQKPATSWVVEDIPEWASVPHLFDLIFVWGIPYWSEFEDRTWELRDKRISDIIMSFWTNFAKASNPIENSAYPILWDQFHENDPTVLLIDRGFNMNKSLNYKGFKFWNQFYPRVVETIKQCCNSTGREK